MLRMWKECYNLLNETFLLHGYALIESRKISWIRFLVSTFTIVIISQMSTVGSFYFFHLEICSHWWKSELIFDFTVSFFLSTPLHEAQGKTCLRLQKKACLFHSSYINTIDLFLNGPGAMSSRDTTLCQTRSNVDRKGVTSRQQAVRFLNHSNLA